MQLGVLCALLCASCPAWGQIPRLLRDLVGWG